MPSPHTYKIEIKALGVTTYYTQQTAKSARSLAASVYNVSPDQVIVTKIK